MIDRETNRSRGFGFVSFAQEPQVERAIRMMDGRELGGRTITVNKAKDRSEQERCAPRVACCCGGVLIVV